MAGLYIHIPFCHSKCAYCDFFSTPRLADMEAVAHAIVSEFGLRCHEVTEPFSTVYLGGGTPSILPPELLRDIIGALPVAGLQEFTIEANPEDITVDRVRAWHDMGINRVSMGVQSLSDEELTAISRRHTAAQAIDAVSAIRQGGIDNISLDLIYGLPLQTPQSWMASLSGVLSLHPQHLSAYMLSYEPGTRLSALLKAGKISPADDDTIVEMYQFLIDTARAHGYEHYEISNFALPRYHAVHNSAYWAGTPYLGLGPSAHSFDGRQRRVNPSSISQYISAISAGTVACVVDEQSRIDCVNDLIVTRLRTAQGLRLTDVPVRYRRQLLCDAYPHLVSGHLAIDGDYFHIPEADWLISDSIMRDLILPSD